MNIADCLPLAVANYYKCIVRIYSSALSTPVLDIKQSEYPLDAISTTINLGYVAIRGKEYYVPHVK